MDVNLKDPDQYYKFVKSLYNLIYEDIDRAIVNQEVQMYPKAIVMYQFFRFLRGEAFLNRQFIPEQSKEFYQMENNILQNIYRLKSRVESHPNFARYIQDMQKRFELPDIEIKEF